MFYYKLGPGPSTGVRTFFEKIQGAETFIRLFEGQKVWSSDSGVFIDV